MHINITKKMNDKSTQTEISINNNVYNRTNNNFIPIYIDSEADINMLINNIDISENIIGNIPRPILRRNTNQIHIDTINNHNHLPNNILNE